MERLEKNFLWLTAANIAGSLFTALLMIYLARTLEAEYFGYYSYATALVFYLFNFVDLGLSTYGIRAVAKDHQACGEYVSHIVSFKLIIALVLFAAFVAVSFMTPHTAAVKFLLAEAALMFFAAAVATEWAFQGMEKMYMVFISFTVTPLLQLVFSLLMVRGPSDLLKVPVIAFLGSLPIAVSFLRLLRFRFGPSHVDFGKIKTYLSSSLVIWGISVFAQAYNGLDIVILGFFRAPAEVGCFTVARRMVGGAAVLLMLLANAVLPRLSCTFGPDMAQFRHTTARFLRISALLVGLVFVPLAVFSDQVIYLTVGGQYMAASAPLRIMVCALVLVMFNLPYSTGLIAACFERDVLKQAFASASLSVILNFALMPKYGMIGAAISFFSAESLALIWILVIYHKRIRLQHK